MKEAQLRASELSYRRLFEAAKDGILILDVETGRIDDVNPFLFKLLGFSRSEMVGKTVGEPTAGWIIFTNNLTLLDGTGFRLPHTDIRDHAGNPMEMHPRPVDTLVVRPAGEGYTRQDIQLRKAAEELLGQLMSPERQPEIQDH